MGAEIHPLYDLVIVNQIEEPAEKIGAIYLPDRAKERPQEGIVIAKGPGRLLPDGSLRPLEVAIGDRVLFGKYAGSQVKLGGDTFLLLREGDIIATLGHGEGSDAKRD